MTKQLNSFSRQRQSKKMKRQLLKQHYKNDTTKINPIVMKFTLEELGLIHGALRTLKDKDKTLNGKIVMNDDYVSNKTMFYDNLIKEVHDNWQRVYINEDKDFVHNKKESA
tara:strand:+ start:249 stop:581 length:333 start_codon:yes stop_codon:yes gene_type:complete